MMNNVFISKDVYKEINKLKKENIKAYRKILKKIERLQSVNLERLESLKDISKMELNGEDAYLYELDVKSSFVYIINDNKIYIIDYMLVIDGNVESVLIKNYEAKNNKKMVETEKNKTS